MGLRTSVLLVAAMLVLSDVRADLLDEVPQQARDELAGGQIVVKSENVQGAPWPRLKLYKVVMHRRKSLLSSFPTIPRLPPIRLECCLPR